MSTAITVTTRAVHSAKTPTPRPTPIATELSEDLSAPETKTAVFFAMLLSYRFISKVSFYISNNAVANQSISIISGTHILRKADYERLKFARLAYKLLLHQHCFSKYNKKLS